jgi:protein-S-isoprenylcysteine O-methyltransferase Ste14
MNKSLSILIFNEFFLCLRERGPYEGAYKRAAAAPPAKKIDRLVILIMVAVFAYSIFLPLQIGSTWFYIRIPIFSIGLIIVTIASVNFATTPLATSITKGLYSYSRHPMYLAMFLEYIGMSMASASWVLVVFSRAFIFLVRIEAVSEERFCFTIYGDTYREYMNRTPITRT